MRNRCIGERVDERDIAVLRAVGGDIVGCLESMLLLVFLTVVAVDVVVMEDGFVFVDVFLKNF